MKLRDYVPALKYGAKLLPNEVLGVPGMDSFHNTFWVDGDNGSDANSGTDPELATATIGAAILLASAGDTIYVKARKTVAGSTDPTSYAETVIIPVTKPELKIVGVGTGRVQNGLPQIKPASTTSPLITVRASGVLIAGIGINGINSTGGGILLDDDGSTKTANGTTIIGCHFKNCVGTTATDSRTGGAIMWSAAGNAWQVRIAGNRFYKNVGDIVLKGTSSTVPQDVIIEDNVFSGPTASVDCNLFLAGGSGMNGVIVRNNEFPSVLPSLSSGSVVRYADLTGCIGLFAGNRFGGSYTTSGFGVAKAAAKIPVTVGLAQNYSDGGLIVREA